MPQGLGSGSTCSEAKPLVASSACLNDFVNRALAPPIPIARIGIAIDLGVYTSTLVCWDPLTVRRVAGTRRCGEECEAKATLLHKKDRDDLASFGLHDAEVQNRAIAGCRQPGRALGDPSIISARRLGGRRQVHPPAGGVEKLGGLGGLGGVPLIPWDLSGWVWACGRVGRPGRVGRIVSEIATLISRPIDRRHPASKRQVHPTRRADRCRILGQRHHPPTIEEPNESHRVMTA
jgi:hypothetical protein